jgi:NADPH-dependent 2,4-dienoyl-CoA reductase/sulfur reductase-like enzyme
MNPLDFAARLLGYCAATQASVKSWGRTLKHNANVGGNVDSYHLAWLAADVVYDFPTEPGFRSMVAHRYGLELVVEDNHDHLEPHP